MKHRFGPFSFKVGSLQKMPVNLIGIYAFWYKKKCIYIGQAKDQPLRDRLWQHYDNCHNLSLKLWIDAYGKDLEFCFISLSYKRINVLERILIKRHQPRANVLLKK